MNPIYESLESGYTPEEILKFISKAMPHASSAIRKANKAGYTVQQILGFLSKNFDTEDRRGMSSSERTAANRRSDAAMTKYGLKLAASAVTAPLVASGVNYALSRAIPQSLSRGIGQQAIGGLLSDNVGNQQNASSSQVPQQTPQVGSQQQNLSQQPPVNQVAPNIPQIPQVSQSEGIINPKNYLEKKGLLPIVVDSLKRGNKPESIAAEIGIKRSGKAEIDPELLSNIEAYAQTTQQQPQASAPMEPTGMELGEGKPKVEGPKIEKGSVASSPNGIGTIKEIRNGQAIIDVDGKLHKVKEEELEASPLPEKDLADLYDELTHGIEKETGEDVSRMVQWAGYNPENNTLTFLPHTGKLYTYDNISPEDTALLRDVLSTRKTSGSNFIGAWKAGSKSSIGAALSKLIRKLQAERGGKGNEYSNTHETIYSAYEPAIEAKKNKKIKT